MKTEVFVGSVPGMINTATIVTTSKNTDDPVTILLLDTPQNTPVGSPASTLDVSFEQEEESEVQTVSEPIAVPRRQREQYRNDFTDFFRMTNKMLGEGASATVLTCIELNTGKEFAAKVVLKSTEDAKCRVHNELNTLYMCRKQPNIVKLVKSFEEDDRFILIFEKCLGGSLVNQLCKRNCFTEQETSEIIKDIAEGLKFLHSKGIAHRDLKLDNILCSSEDSVCPVKIADFDLCSGLIHMKQSRMNIATFLSAVGSPEFLAPEVVLAFIGTAPPYDKRCDLWSLGVIMYVLLCGYPPFSGLCDEENCGGFSCDYCQIILFNNIQRGVYEFPPPAFDLVSEEAKHLISQLLVKEPEKRLSADEVLIYPWITRNFSKDEASVGETMIMPAQKIHSLETTNEASSSLFK